AAIALLGLKLMALADLPQGRVWALMAVAGWGRWGQVVAIARYPYLKPEGKGAFHKAHAHPRVDWIVGWVALMGLSGAMITLGHLSWMLAGGTAFGGMGLALGAGAWFHRQLGGHTGDTYGAVVEWTEALLLCLITALA
ncbi:MAG: adenosylcobinamide-GDP ribazoletransferase, partial [Leptolyngbya sp. RL_3_1]|nr:adenosylcobinamide-GDP ribazoletransferase [Leptolyngbya sp. RL_3_1]